MGSEFLVEWGWIPLLICGFIIYWNGVKWENQIKESRSKACRRACARCSKRYNVMCIEGTGHYPETEHGSAEDCCHICRTTDRQIYQTTYDRDVPIHNPERVLFE